MAEIRQEHEQAFGPKHRALESFTALACKYDTIEKIVLLAGSGPEMPCVDREHAPGSGPEMPRACVGREHAGLELAAQEKQRQDGTYLAPGSGPEMQESLSVDCKVDPWAWKRREYEDFLWDALLGAILLHARNVLQTLDARLGQCEWAIAACEKFGVDAPLVGSSCRQNWQNIRWKLKEGFERSMHGILCAAARRHTPAGIQCQTSGKTGCLGP